MDKREIYNYNLKKMLSELNPFSGFAQFVESKWRYSRTEMWMMFFAGACTPIVIGGVYMIFKNII